MEKAIFRRDQCDFSCNEPMCHSMDKAGIPNDSKWRTMILFTRSIKNHYFLNQRQKEDIQSALINVVKEKDFSEKKFRTLVDKSQAIISAPFIEKLEETIEESEALLNECKKLVRKRKGDIQDIETTSVSSILSGKEPKDLIRELKTAFHSVIDSMEQDVAELDQLSKTDGLTGLSNRRTFDEYLTEHVAKTFKGGPLLSLIMLDIDHFKKFNDQFGHRIGDQAISTVAKVLRESAESFKKGEGKSCLAARYGGEEFALVLPNISAKEAFEKAEIIRQRIENYNFVIRNTKGEITKEDIKITASVGVAEANFIDNKDVRSNTQQIIENADKGLYAAKEHGRNITCAYPGHFEIVE